MELYTKIAGCIKSKITEPVHINLSLTASHIAQGKGLPFIPSAQVHTLENSHKLLNMAKKVVASFRSTGLLQNLKNWLTQLNDNAISGDNNDKLQKLQKTGKTIYVVSWY